MLKEKKDLPQKEEEGFRRWFEDEDFELILWYEHERKEGVVSFTGYLKTMASKFLSTDAFLKSQGITGFQLVYARQNDEKAISWTVEDGFAHFSVASGLPTEMGPTFEANYFLSCFEQSASELEAPIRQFVLKKLREFFLSF